MASDYILNGAGYGGVAQTMLDMRLDPGMMRPFYDSHGERCVTINTGRKKMDNRTGEYVPVYKKARIADLQARGINSPVFNSTALQKEAWIELDKAVVRATRLRLRAWADLSSMSSRGGFNAMSRMTLEYQAMSDPGEAVVDMDGITDGRTDRPIFNLKSIPLPITHSDFWFSAREIAVSRNTSTPLDTTMAEAAGRRVAEMIEKTLIGTETGMTYGTQTAGVGAHTGTSTVYGYTNFPYRVTKTDLHSPDASSPQNVLEDVLEMVETMQGNGFFGPYMLYHSTGYTRFLNDDYFRTGGVTAIRSLKQRLMEIDGLTDIRRLDFLTSGYQLLLVQLTPDVVQAINGLDITTVMWDSQGSMRTNWKCLAIQVPLLKSPLNGVSGILHATTS